MENYFGIPIIPENDEDRISALKRYRIVDTPPEDAFNNVANLAARIFKVPIALVTLVDKDRVFFKANVGMDGVKNVRRGLSLCSLAILNKEVSVFENALEEPCLLSNPLVAGEFGLKFYAGAPLTTHDGYQIGSICVVDKQSRKFSDMDRLILQGLASIVMDEIELRLSAIKENERYQLIAKATQDVLWDWDVKTNTVVWNKAFEFVFGYRNLRPEEGSNSFFDRIHPEDSDKIRGAFDSALAANKTSVQEEFRFLKADYSYAHTLFRGFLMYNEKGELYRVLGSMIDITEKVRAEQERRQATERLMRQKDEFMTIASHELKTPVTSMKASLQIAGRLIKERENTPLLVDYLERANRNAAKISALVNDLMDVSKIQSGSLKFNLSLFTIGEIIGDAIEVIPGNTHKIIVEGDTKCLVNGDRLRLEQVLINLLSNAGKYSPHGERIEVFVKKDGDNVRVSIKDFGIGIPEEKLPNLFHRFYRVEEISSKYSGMGLGLYISSEIIKRHNGEIGVSSKNGKGATFWFSIPAYKGS